VRCFVDAKEGTLTLGEWKYKLQGPVEDPEKFIARYPHKEQSAP
jgi:hypothetical protein